MIVCNPPYYPNHLRSKDERKNIAHHQASLSLVQLHVGVEACLAGSGELWVILPPSIMDDFCVGATKFNLHPFFQLELFDRLGTEMKRKVMAFGRKNSDKACVRRIFIKEGNGNFTSNYQHLLKDFMLNF